MSGLGLSMVCQSEYLFTEGTTADCTKAIQLIDGLDAKALLADRGYDTDEIIEKVTLSGIDVVIPPKKNRKEQRNYDKHTYRIHNMIENTFLHLKRWRGIATRYEKLVLSFLSAVV